MPARIAVVVPEPEAVSVIAGMGVEGGGGSTVGVLQAVKNVVVRRTRVIRIEKRIFIMIS